MSLLSLCINKNSHNGLFAVMLGLILSFSSFSSRVDAAWKDHTYYPNEEWLATYLSEMPWRHYKSYEVKGLGWFWVDNARDCVKDTIKSGKLWEVHIIELLKKYVKPGDQVIDLGAHMGTISLMMSNIVGPTGRVYAFEGERQLFRELMHNAHSNSRTNIIPYLCWVSDKEGECSDFPDGYGFEYSPVRSANEKPWVRHIHKLDSFGFENISLMKIDVECTEDEVLMGAQELISKSRPVIIIEIMGGYGWK